MAILKADLHIHTSEDPEDLILYSATELIDMACRLGYSVLAITNHNCVTYSGYLRDYAKERGIVLIPGMEATIQGRHVLLHNMDFQQVKRDKIARLDYLKRPDNLIIAPHPYFPGLVSLRGMLRRHVNLFDAVEYCHFYSERLDFNRPAIKFAKEHDLPMVGSSDAHQRCQFHTTYSLIEAEPEPESVIRAVKSGKVRIVTRPLPLSLLLKIELKMFWRNRILKRF
ncbi:MAG: PHP domain-containing protein [Deltaproteobacteria bacterium]|nr:PHP domain-containing protein [Deltaproteobacteria bacterium]MBW1965979.1 PHP domain-containing protein [Deltaproteobacteria bacterium]MBW2097423.1 PHP domain-containing protein [Deltaproteobacteria bacterium]